MMKRVKPTEKAIRGLALKAFESSARVLCVRDDVKANTRPKMGNPVGPGMTVLDRGFERDHARPPGARTNAKMETKTIVQRKSSKLSTDEAEGIVL